MKILNKECKSFEIIEYLKKSIDKMTIQNILDALNINVIDLVRKNEKQFKDLSLSQDQLDNDELLINLIIKYPKIMQRPIIIKNDKGVIGRPPENIYKIL